MKRLISLLIALALILPALPPALASGTVPGTPPIPSVGDVWDGSAEQPVSLVERNGVYYYEITRCAQLAFIAQNGGDWLGYNYILGADLIFNDVVLTWDEDGKLLTDPATATPSAGFTAPYPAAMPGCSAPCTARFPALQLSTVLFAVHAIQAAWPGLPAASENPSPAAPFPARRFLPVPLPAG